MLSQASLVFVALLSFPISALALSAPSVTHTPQPYGVLTYHSQPEPTEAPYPHDLLRRQSASAQRTLLAAPDNTWNCVFATPTPVPNSTQSPAPGSVLCCDPSTGCPSYPAPTACVDRYNNAISTTRSGSSSADPMTLTCTSGIYIFCNTLTFASPSVSALFCNYISNTAAQNATTTYAEQTNHAFTPTVPIFAVSSTPTPSTTSILSATKSSAKSSSGSATATAAPSTGAKKNGNKAAIVGGVIGGVVGLALWTALVVLFMKWRYGGRAEEKGEEGNTESPASEEVAAKPANKA